MASKVKVPPVALNEDIQRSLPDAEPSQVQRFADQVKRLEATERFFASYPEDRPDFELLLARASKALDYKRPYRIAVIGTTGAGKSTLINALLCRDLVLVKDIGKPATGTVLDIFLDVAQDGQEVAQVIYRDEANIRALVAAFVQNYELDGSTLSADLNADYSKALLELTSTRSMSERASREFEGLRASLSRLVGYYAEYAGEGAKSLNRTIKLDDQEQVAALLRLVDEHSEEGPPSALVQKVQYHIKPRSVGENGQGAGLQLPNNVCLVDLPGLGGDPLHDIIIEEGIKEADAVVFIVRPPRILDLGDEYLLSGIKKYVSLDKTVEAADRVFIVLNAQDAITRDDISTLENLPRDMRDLMELIAPGYAKRFADRGGNQPYFMTSAWMAYNAQRALGGQAIENPNVYEGKAVQYKVKPTDHEAILAVSRIPALVTALSQFARERRIEGQIREGREAIERILQALNNKYTSEIDLRTGGQGVSYFDKEDDHLLAERQKEMVKLVFEFRSRQLAHMDELQNDMRKTAERICDDIDTHLMEMLPSLWRRSFIDSEYIPGAFTNGITNDQMLLSDTELLLWQELTLRLKELADLLAHVYRQSLEDYRVQQRIIDLGYDQPQARDVADQLDELVAGMRESLTEISKRVALMILAKQDNTFISPKSGTKEALKAALGTLPRKRETQPSDFKGFIGAVREHYESTVRVFSVNSLLSVYQYEMVHIETVLREAVDGLFKQLHRRIDGDGALRDYVRSSAPNANRDKVDLLYRKRAALPPLHEARTVGEAAKVTVDA